MPDPRRPPVVAVLNTSTDLVDLLRQSLERAGLVAVSAHPDDMRRGQTSLVEFVSEHDPDVIVYDVAPPYEQSWRFLEHIRQTPQMARRKFVITSANIDRVREVVGADERVFEIVGKPYDLHDLTEAVRQAVRARPTRD